jgi:hypothetical protein
LELGSEISFGIETCFREEREEISNKVQQKQRKKNVRGLLTAKKTESRLQVLGPAIGSKTADVLTPSTVRLTHILDS